MAFWAFLPATIGPPWAGIIMGDATPYAVQMWGGAAGLFVFGAAGWYGVKDAIRKMHGTQEAYIMAQEIIGTWETPDDVTKAFVLAGTTLALEVSKGEVDRWPELEPFLKFGEWVAGEDGNAMRDAGVRSVSFALWFEDAAGNRLDFPIRLVADTKFGRIEPQ